MQKNISIIFRSREDQEQPEDLGRDNMSKKVKRLNAYSFSNLHLKMNPLKDEVKIIVKRIFLKLIFTGIQLLYNAVLVSTLQNESVNKVKCVCVCVCVCIPSLFQTSFLFSSPQNTEVSSLCIQQALISYLFCIQWCVYVNPNSQFIPHPIPPRYPYICSLHLCVYFYFSNKRI